MTTVRSAKNKGSQFEMDSEASLQQLYSDCFRTHERGYISEYDLQSKLEKKSFECKRLKSMSWNQAKSYLEKLIKRSPEGYKGYLLFKSNQQPCLVMQFGKDNHLIVMEFEDLFGVPFIKHQSTRKREVKENEC